ncbi:MAG TPA: GNAT family N-acetyltransferase [Alphaproteobacteria bacterium]|jgi:ribosomal protein S18 acetylase RimI-like enzyme|nr:GNAT family N-acetyltransferase [Alphaproteobacteria bacterium]
MTKAFDGQDGLSISILSDTDNSGAAYVASSLAGDVLADFGPRGETPLSIVARDGNMIVGGLNGSSHWGWCYIRHLWVDADWRRHGLGRRLLAEAEAQAKMRGCAGLYVDTFNEAAVVFYERAGFERFGRIEGFPPGHARTFLVKRLNS